MASSPTDPLCAYTHICMYAYAYRYQGIRKLSPVHYSHAYLHTYNHTQVRFAVAILDLDVKFLPCPRNGVTYRPFVEQRGGKARFPYMIDTNTGIMRVCVCVCVRVRIDALLYSLLSNAAARQGSRI